VRFRGPRPVGNGCVVGGRRDLWLL
jgi:hypothetical protein